MHSSSIPVLKVKKAGAPGKYHCSNLERAQMDENSTLLLSTTTN